MNRINQLNRIRDNIQKIGVKAYIKTKDWSDSILETKAEIVIVFNKAIDEKFVDWLISEIHDQVPQLLITKKFHKLSSQFAIHLSCGFKDLLIGAEKIALKKRLTDEYGGHLTEFTIDSLTSFINNEEENLFFTSEERILITNSYLSQFRADNSDFGNEFKIRIEKGEQIIVKLQTQRIVDQIFPLHDRVNLRYLKDKWFSNFSFTQPIQLAREYFGIKTGFYFAWMDHYTKSLIFPAIISILYWLCQENHLVVEKKCSIYILYIFLFFIWVTFYLTSWRRASTEYAYQWGTIDAPSELLEEPRPEFKGTYELCPITKQYNFQYPEKKRYMTMLFVSLPVSVLSLICIIAFSLSMKYFQDSVDKYCEQKFGKDLKFQLELLKLIPNIIFSLGVILFDSAYRSLSMFLTNLENHRLDEEHNKFFAARLFIFQFFNAYFFLFYTAFVTQDLESLVSLLSTALIMRQIVGNFKEVFLPLGLTKWKQFLISFNYHKEKLEDHSGDDVTTSINEDEILQAESEATKLKYDDSSEDYIEMVLQFGYISMFAAVFPLGPVFALANNIVEIRSDAFKLMTLYQRPFPKKTNNIGIWQAILDYMSYLSLITNFALLLINGTIDIYLPKYQKYQQILILIAIEHLIIFVRSIVNHAISSVPLSVQKSLAILEVQRRETFKLIEKELRKEAKNMSKKLSTEQRD